MKEHYFTVGPSQLFYTVENHIKQALKENIGSISHRERSFSDIFKGTSDAIRTLLSIPETHHIAFTGSATEVWERLIQNVVMSESFHLVNGAFSEKFYNISEMMGRTALKNDAKPGKCVDIEKILIPETAELIAITHNETSTGAMYQTEDITKLAKAFPDQIIAVDIVSSAPIVTLDWSVVDTAYFSVQKAFGLPAGLGCWIFNDKCIEKSHKILDEGRSIGSYHCIPELFKNLKKNQTPETPNILGIYLLGKVAEDMLSIGMDKINRDIKYKAAVLYQALEKADGLMSFVTDKANRSLTTIVGSGPRAKVAKEYLYKKHLIVGSGYGAMSDEHIRIANFPTHSNEQIEMLADYLVKGEF